MRTSVSVFDKFKYNGRNRVIAFKLYPTIYNNLQQSTVM